MNIEAEIGSLESKLLERGYTESSEILPGHTKPMLMKGKIGVYLSKPIADYKDYCVMEMEIPSISEDVPTYWLLFGVHQCGKEWRLHRRFPYAKVTSCAFATHYWEYLLPLSDEEKALETIEKEVKFTKDMLVNAGVLIIPCPVV